MFWFKLSTIILVPHDAIKKKPIVTAQHAIIGQLGRRRCKDSVVAQQLTAAKARNPATANNFRNLFSFIYSCP